MTQVTDRALLAMLDQRPEKLEKHLEKCPDDIARLEYLTELPPQQKIEVALHVQAPPDLALRIAARMKVDPGLRDAGAAFLGLLTLGFDTARVVLGSTETPEKGTK